MLTKLIATNFKLFDRVEIELADRVVFVGPNNSGKSTALQALALWSIGVQKWLERRGDGEVPKERAGVTINRRDLIASPVPVANLLWRDRHTQKGRREDGKTKTQPVRISLVVEGVSEGKSWSAPLEFTYANEESFYCHAPIGDDGLRRTVPAAAGKQRIAYLPPMSGLAPIERLQVEGAIDVLIGEGRTAEVLRNLCWQSYSRDKARWRTIVEQMRDLFGVRLDDPKYIKERGEIVMTYRTPTDVELDLSASGRGQQQTLLLLAHMAANPNSVLLLDEPDAHLEVLRQRQIYNVLTDAATASQSQIVAASHSEVILEEAADRDTVVAFVGKPHRIDDRGSQLRKALKDIGFESYLQAEMTGWVLYLEGSTDLAILAAFAKMLGHRAAVALNRPFVHYVGNQPAKAREHFYGLREAKPDLAGIAIFDRRKDLLVPDPNLGQSMWRRREIENYLCSRETLLAWAVDQDVDLAGSLFAAARHADMSGTIDEIVGAFRALERPDPWGPDVKASDDFLDLLFRKFFERLSIPNLMSKTDYHTLVPYVPLELIDPEISEKLDLIAAAADRAKPRGAAE